ncbi:alpha-hydroxy acid oxidase [Actinoallomurus sp. CA-150999]|uniref:alpha-hydroxy acid oxidase n=1 Tax=Actinoallomurus sp. CA-150999 TaxID=3239887 RepID=UPI003D9086F4
MSVNLREIRSLIRLEPFERDPVRRRLAHCHDIDDLRRVARRRTPRAVFDYVDGGADDEISMAANVDALRRWRFTPRSLADVSSVDTATRLFDRPAALPLVLAPTGYTRMMHPVGEPAVARVTARRGVPYTLSTVGTTSVEDLAAIAGHPDLWFQLYVWKDRKTSWELVDRAAAAGYRVLEVTVDTAVAGHRGRDLRNGLTVPPSLTVRTLLDLGSRPGYWTRMLRSPGLEFANLAGANGVPGSVTMENMAGQFGPVTWEDIAELRRRWAGPLVVKGPVGPDDARRAVDAGVDGLHLSNHGGRQLDRLMPPIDTVAEVRAAVGDDVCVLVDSGIRHGADLAVAVALGADAGAIGRAYLYGLMAGGIRGVDRALELLTAQFTRTLQLLGVSSVRELRDHGRELIRREPG